MAFARSPPFHSASLSELPTPAFTGSVNGVVRCLFGSWNTNLNKPLFPQSRHIPVNNNQKSPCWIWVSCSSEKGLCSLQGDQACACSSPSLFYSCHDPVSRAAGKSLITWEWYSAGQAMCLVFMSLDIVREQKESLGHVVALGSSPKKEGLMTEKVCPMNIYEIHGWVRIQI